MSVLDIKFGLFDASGNPITGTNLLVCKIKRDTDDYFYDFSDGTFKAAGWTMLAGVMTEIDPPIVPGEYEYQVDISGWNDGFYTAYCEYSGAPPQHGAEEVNIVNGQVLFEAPIEIIPTRTFCGLCETKLYLGLTGITEHDVLLQLLIEEVTSDFQNYMDRWFFLRDWEEKFDIETEQQACIQLKEYPIVSIRGIADAGLSLTTSDYLVYNDTGQVCLDRFYFSKGRQRVEISYWAGYPIANIPKKLCGACKEEVAQRFNAGDPTTGDIYYEKIGDYAYRKSTYGGSAKLRTYGFSPRVKRALDYYRDSPL